MHSKPFFSTFPILCFCDTFCALLHLPSFYPRSLTKTQSFHIWLIVHLCLFVYLFTLSCVYPFLNRGRCYARNLKNVHKPSPNNLLLAAAVFLQPPSPLPPEACRRWWRWLYLQPMSIKTTSAANYFGNSPGVIYLLFVSSYFFSIPHSRDSSSKVVGVFGMEKKRTLPLARNYCLSKVNRR